MVRDAVQRARDAFRDRGGLPAAMPQSSSLSVRSVPFQADRHGPAKAWVKPDTTYGAGFVLLTSDFARDTRKPPTCTAAMRGRSSIRASHPAASAGDTNAESR